MLSSFRFLFLLISLALHAGCGGEVHFVTDQSAQSPSPPQPNNKTITETFRYGKPSGNQVIAFVFDNQKSMIPLRYILADQLSPIGKFSDRFWDQAEYLTEANFFVQRDAIPYSTQQFSAKAPDQVWKGYNFKTTDFLIEALQNNNTPFLLNPPSYPSVSPFELFDHLSKEVSIVVSKSESPVWFHLIYFRNSDFQNHLKEDENYLQESARAFQKNLQQKPLSKSRFFIYFVSQIKDKLPYRKATIKAQTILNQFNSKFLDIDPFIENDLIQCGDLTNRLAQEIQAQNSRIILREPANQMSLEVKINSTLIPREQIQYDPEQNEIQFRAPVNSWAKEGDRIQVRYDKKN